MAAMNSMNAYTYCLQNEYIYSNLKKIGEGIYEYLQNAYCTPLEFLAEANFDVWDPEIHDPRNYLQSIIWLLSFKNAVKKVIIHLERFQMVFQEKGEDNLIMKV